MTAEVRSIEKKLTPHSLLAMLFSKHADIKSIGVILEWKEEAIKNESGPYLTAFSHGTSAVDAAFYLRLMEKCYEAYFNCEYTEEDHI